MTKHIPAKTDKNLPTIGRGWRVVISLLAVWQVLAVLAEPLRFFSQSPVKFASEEARLLRLATRPYSDFMYLSHGYSFFAPNPGPSHLLECEMRPNSNVAMDVRQANTGRPLSIANRQSSHESNWRIFPDGKQDWPRLFYHRHFMLSEFYHAQFAPAVLAEQEKLDAGIRDQWQQDRHLYEQLQKSIQTNLAQAYPNCTVSLRRIEHALPSEYQVLVERWKLTDPRLYVELLEGDTPMTSPESLPKP